MENITRARWRAITKSTARGHFTACRRRHRSRFGRTRALARNHRSKRFPLGQRLRDKSLHPGGVGFVRLMSGCSFVSPVRMRPGAAAVPPIFTWDCGALVRNRRSKRFPYVSALGTSRSTSEDVSQLATLTPRRMAQIAFACAMVSARTSGVSACFGSSPMPWLGLTCASMHKPSAP